MRIIRAVIGLLGLLAAVSAILTLFVTVGEAWWWHRVEGWPEAAAMIGRCDLDLRHYNGPDDDDPTWVLQCPIRFSAGAREIATTIRSGAPSRFKNYPDLMIQWIDRHPNGSSIAIRYDPADPNKATPVSDYMPNAAPRTRWYVTFFFGLLCAGVVLLGTARWLRPRMNMDDVAGG